jgi:hypothetical protein
MHCWSGLADRTSFGLHPKTIAYDWLSFFRADT